MKKGIDAPIVPILFSVIGVIGILIAWQSQNPYNFILAILFIHTSLDGKYKIIHDVVKSLDIPNDSQILDLGTGFRNWAWCGTISGGKKIKTTW